MHNIVAACKKHEDDFKGSLVPYEDRGIFNSELLLVVAMARELGVRKIVESGRYRGHSTEVLARCLPNVQIVSVDINADEHARYAIKKLAHYHNVSLVTGDGMEHVPLWANVNHDDTLILLDAPKGYKAIRLAQQMLNYKHVLGVFIHDLYAPTMERFTANKVMPNNYFTDDEEYVETFRHLDEECWAAIAKVGGIPEQPHVRRGKLIKSYASTLGMFRP